MGFSEDLLLEYANGMEGSSLGWGRLTRENLDRVLEIHAVYSDLMRRTPYLARARGSNLLADVLQSLEQAETGKPVPVLSAIRDTLCRYWPGTIPICPT